LLLNFTINYEETASNALNYTFKSRKTELAYSSKMYSNNICFIYNYLKKIAMYINFLIL